MEQLKEDYRDLKRRETKSCRSTCNAEAFGKACTVRLDATVSELSQAQNLMHARLEAGNHDKQVLFSDAQSVEDRMQGERARKIMAQTSTAHYRALLQI